MKLIIQNNRVVGTAEDEHVATGGQTAITAPEGFDVARMAEYAYDPVTGLLPTILDLKWADIVAERNRRWFEGGAKVGSLWFLSHNQAVGEYTSILVLAQKLGLPGATVMRADWRSMSEETQNMTPDLAAQILQAGMAMRAAVDDASQVHKVAMEAAEDPASYDFSGGWPETFVPV